MILQLKAVGILLIILALVHVFFPRYFNWREELSQLSLINQQMMEVHTFFVALMVFMMGLMCILFPNDLLHNHFGKLISLGLSIFWAIRLIIQFLWYSKKLWYGKGFETTVHIGFSILWAYLTGVFFLAFYL